MRDLLSALSCALDGREIKVFLVLWTASEDGVLTATHQAIAAASGLGVSTVQRSLAALEKRGLVESSRRGPGGQTYRLHPEQVFSIIRAAVLHNSSLGSLSEPSKESSRLKDRSDVTDFAALDRSDVTDFRDEDTAHLTDLQPENRANLTDLSDSERQLRVDPSGNTKVLREGGGQRTPAGAGVRAPTPGREGNPDARAAAAALQALGFSEEKAGAWTTEYGPAVVLSAARLASERQARNPRGFVTRMIHDPDFRAEVEADEQRAAQAAEQRRGTQQRRDEQATAVAHEASERAKKIEAERAAIVARIGALSEAELIAALGAAASTLTGILRRSADATLRRMRAGERTPRQVAVGPTFRVLLPAVLSAKQTGATSAPAEGEA